MLIGHLRYVFKESLVGYDGFKPPPPPRGGGTPIYGLSSNVPRNRVWFLRFLVLEWDIFFDPFVIVFLVWSLDRVASLYYLIVECENARLNECLGLKKVSVFAFLALTLSRTFEAHPYDIQNSREYLPRDSSSLKALDPVTIKRNM